MKRTTFLALAMSLGLMMSAEQAGAMVANQGLAATAANAKQTATVTQVWWRGGRARLARRVASGLWRVAAWIRMGSLCGPRRGSSRYRRLLLLQQALLWSRSLLRPRFLLWPLRRWPVRSAAAVLLSNKKKEEDRQPLLRLPALHFRFSCPRGAIPRELCW